jgi:hypothetical protein
MPGEVVVTLRTYKHVEQLEASSADLWSSIGPDHVGPAEQVLTLTFSVVDRDFDRPSGLLLITE